MESPIPDDGRHARPANDVSKARADVSSTVRWRTSRRPGPAIITELPRYARRAFSSWGTITMDSPAPPPTRPLPNPGIDGFCQGFRVIPDPVFMEPVTGRSWPRCR